MNKFLISFMLCIVMISMVSAVKPTYESGVDGGLQFAPSTTDAFKSDTLFKVHLHVINDTEVQRNDTTSCEVHLYDTYGNHILEELMLWDSNNDEFKLDIPAEVQTLGQHAYIIWCNNTNQQIHLVKGGYEVTENGQPIPEGIVCVFFAFFALASFLFMLRTLYLILGALTTLSTTWETVFLGLSAYFINLINYYFLYNFLSLPLMSSLSLTLMASMGITHVFVPFIGIIFSWIKNGEAS